MIGIPGEVALRTAVAAANAASASLMSDFGRDRNQSKLKAWMKSPGALVTEADLAADKAIASALAESGVEAALVSEESNSGDSFSADVWLVDPLCGTVPFRSGMPHWGVNVALRQGEQITTGVIALPHSEQIMAASSGNGVTLNDDQIVSQDPELPLSEAIVGLEVDGGSEWARLLSVESGQGPQLRWLSSISHTNTFASAAYPIAMVCLGGMSGVVFYTIDSVHLAAGALIAQELGATVSDQHGKALDWRSEKPFPVAIVAWPSVHADLITAMSN